MLADYLAAEAAIIGRLKEQVAGFAGVLGAGDLGAVEEKSQQTPAAHVLYDGDVVAGGGDGRGGNNAAQMVMQRWMVVVAVRNARDPLGGTGARADAGPLITGVIRALSGWAPTEFHRPLRRVQAPRPGYNKGFAYFPLVFEGQILTGSVV